MRTCAWQALARACDMKGSPAAGAPEGPSRRRPS